MDHERQTGRMRETDLVYEDATLGLPLGMHVVVVEATLPHTDNTWVIEQLRKTVDSAVGLVGMDTSGRPHCSVTFRAADARSRALNIAPDVDQRDDPCARGLVDHLCRRRVRQVAMLVDPRRRGRARGISHAGPIEFVHELSSSMYPDGVSITATIADVAIA